MKRPEENKSISYRPAKYLLLMLIAAVPLTVTTITHNQSDLPKNAVLIIITGLICVLTACSYLIAIFSKGNNDTSFRLNFLPQLDIPVILLFLSALISTLFSINSNNSYYGQYERQIGLLTYINLLIIFFIAASQEEDGKFPGRISLAMEITALIVSLYAVLQQFGIDILGIQPAGDTRPVTTIGSAVFAGGFLVIVLPISALNISGKKNAVLKYLIPAIILAGIIVTRTRSAYTAAIAELAVLFFIFILNRANEKGSKGNTRKLIYISSAAVLLLILLAVLMPDNIYVQRFVSIFSGGDNPRWMIWRDAFGILGKYPITGPGLANFPNAFADFYSYELRYQDVMRYVDNAHNNYLQVLFTMGSVGLVCYMALLFSAFRICYKNLLAGTGNSKIYFAAMISSLAGYLVYGLTNFDELTIMLYFTLLLVLIRAGVKEKKISELKNSLMNKASLGLILLAVSVFAVINSIDAVKIFFSDVHFLKGEKLMLVNDFKGGIKEMNNAVIMQPDNPVYRYLLAENVYTFINTNRNINETIREDLLRQAANEVIKARKNHSNVNDCDGLLSLIYFEQGKTGEAEELKSKVLNADGVNILYRINLAYSYIKHNNLNAAKEQIDAVNKIGFKKENFFFAAALYNFKAGDKPEALRYIDMILNAEPTNPDALELQKQILTGQIK